MSSLDSLRNKDLFRIVSFIGNVPDLLSCERTCRKLRSIVRSDESWRHCEGDWWAEDRIETNRERAIRHFQRVGRREMVILSIREHQHGKLFDLRNKLHSEKSFILRTYGVRGWRRFWSRIFGHYFEPTTDEAGDFMRWDTLIYLALIVESNMIEFLYNAVCLLVFRRQEGVYPVLQDKDLHFAARLSFPAVVCAGHLYPEREKQMIGIDEQGQQLVIHLFRLSGIVEFELSTVARAWECFTWLSGELFRRAHIMVDPSDSNIAGDFLPLQREALGKIGFQNIEVAAQYMGLHNQKIYGVFEDTIADDHSECSVDNNSCDQEDCTSMSVEETDSDAFSVYSDTKCPDH